MKVSKASYLRLSNFLLYLSSCALLGSGLAIYFRLPRGAGWRATVLGLSRHEWGAFHFYLSLAALVLVGVHFLLNWNWFKSAVYRRHPLGLILGLLLGLLLIFLPLLWPLRV